MLFYCFVLNCCIFPARRTFLTEITEAKASEDEEFLTPVSEIVGDSYVLGKIILAPLSYSPNSEDLSE